MHKPFALLDDFVNCRIGSLENPVRIDIHGVGVNCRIGSLEISSGTAI